MIKNIQIMKTVQKKETERFPHVRFIFTHEPVKLEAYWNFTSIWLQYADDRWIVGVDDRIILCSRFTEAYNAFDGLTECMEGKAKEYAEEYEKSHKNNN